MDELIKEVIEGLRVMFRAFVVVVVTIVGMIAVPVAVVAVTGNEDAAIFSLVAVGLGGIYAFIRAAMQIS